MLYISETTHRGLGAGCGVGYPRPPLSARFYSTAEPAILSCDQGAFGSQQLQFMLAVIITFVLFTAALLCYYTYWQLHEQT